MVFGRPRRWLYPLLSDLGELPAGDPRWLPACESSLTATTAVAGTDRTGFDDLGTLHTPNSTHEHWV